VRVAADHIVVGVDSRLGRENADSAAIRQRERASDIGADEKAVEIYRGVPVSDDCHAVVRKAIDREPEDLKEKRIVRFARGSNLQSVAGGKAGSAQLDAAVAAARTADAEVEAARQKVAASEAQVNEARSAESAQAHTAQSAQTQITGAQAQVSEAQGRLAQANTAPQQIAVSEAQAQTAGANLESLRAALDEAELQLSYTKIYAPEAGRVTRKSVEVGALVQVGQPLLAVVPGEVWVTANFKESQIGQIRPGQPAEITVDAYSDKTFKGHVDSIQACTGARFSLLPAENATGNYVKVVQRIPVKIVFDEAPDPQHLLAPGMSVVPQVKVK